jgi:hypothetical protein
VNAKSSVQELDRIRRDIGSSLRTTHEIAEAAPQSLMAMLRDIETRIHEAERQRLFAEVDARIAELMRATAESQEH